MNAVRALDGFLELTTTFSKSAVRRRRRLLVSETSKSQADVVRAAEWWCRGHRRESWERDARDGDGDDDNRNGKRVQNSSQE